MSDNFKKEGKEVSENREGFVKNQHKNSYENKPSTYGGKQTNETKPTYESKPMYEYKPSY